MSAIGTRSQTKGPGEPSPDRSRYGLQARSVDESPPSSSLHVISNERLNLGDHVCLLASADCYD